VVRALWRHPLGRVGLLGVAGTAVVALAGPLVAGHDPLVPDLSTRLAPPSGEHLMGTDQLGRDVLARLLVGARISLLIALTSVGLSVMLGVAAGAAGAYYGGWVDGLIMRVVDVVLAVPRIVLLIAAIALLQPSPWSIVLLLALTQWPTPARLVRAEILSLRERDYIEAARVLGLSDGAIVFRHLLPNALSPVLVASMLGVSHTVILEAGLSFLGLGVPLSWGLSSSPVRTRSLPADGGSLSSPEWRWPRWPCPSTSSGTGCVTSSGTGSGVCDERRRGSGGRVAMTAGAAAAGSARSTGLCLREMTVRIPLTHGGVPLAEGVSLSVAPGQILALVGESGSGKTLTGLAIAGLIGAVGGEIRPAGSVDLGGGRAGIVFQDAAASINPVRTVGSQLMETMAHATGRGSDVADGGGNMALEDRAVAGLREVGLEDPRSIMGAWPHQLSLGMLQRVQFALALAADPDVLVADEPTSALDPVLEERLLQLLVTLTRARGLATVLITHDLGAAARISDRVAVMYAGRIMEAGPTPRVLAEPAHPCTRALLAAMPDQVPPGERIPVSPGRMPEPMQRDVRCPFRERCGWAEKACLGEVPVLVVGEPGEGHLSRCVRRPAREGGGTS
jgi:peptide/nickel transport system permease protein